METLKERFAKMDDQDKRDLACGDMEGFEQVLSREVGTWRWGTEHESIVEEVATKKLFSIGYRTQPEEGIQSVEEPIEVRAVTKTVTDYEPIE